MVKRSPSRASFRRARPKGKRKQLDLPGKLSQASLADRERMLDQLFRVILEFSESSGLTTDRAARVFAQARRTVAQTPYRLSDALNFRVMQHIGDVLKAWYTDPQYLDPRGVPSPLPLSGARSVEGLIRRYLPKVNARETARWLIAEGVLRQQSRGRLVPLRRTISFTQPNAMTLDRIPFLVQGLLSTVRHNTEAKAGGLETRCERQLTLNRFPLSEVPRFNWEVKRLVPMLLDQLESWAAPYLQAAEGKMHKTARVGVEVFSYVDEHAQRAKRAKQA
jgi:hypothetical protein